MELQEQVFLDHQGSSAAFGTAMWNRYKSDVLKIIPSFVANSNALLGGLLSKRKWFPRERQVCNPRDPPLKLNSEGRIVVAGRKVVSASTASLSMANSSSGSYGSSGLGRLPLASASSMVAAGVEVSQQGFDLVAETN